MDWDDAHLVLAIARAGTLSGAARSLRVTHSTVFRRLGAIEQALGVRLFDRFRDGYAATPAGDTVAAFAMRFADGFSALERHLVGQDLRPSGTVRITTTDTISTKLMRHVVGLRREYPEIHLEIAVSNAMANLTQREADIAIRPVPEAPETLVGRRIASIAHAIYGAPAYLSRHRSADPSELGWIALDDAMSTTAIGRWMHENVMNARIALRVDALLALRDAASAGIGLALLPCYLGDVERRLCRVAPKPLPDARSALWLLTHSHLRRTGRIRAVMDVLAAAFGSERALFEGKQPAKVVASRATLRVIADRDR